MKMKIITIFIQIKYEYYQRINKIIRDTDNELHWLLWIILWIKIISSLRFPLAQPEYLFRYKQHFNTMFLRSFFHGIFSIKYRTGSDI